MTQTGQRNYRNFKELIPSLRAGALAGMATIIKLEPESANMLADILEVFEAMAEKHAKEKKQ